MTSTQLEYEITQWLDGELPPARAAWLRHELQRNPRARQWLDEYTRLNRLLASTAPVPQVDEAQLQQRISRAIDRHSGAQSTRFVWTSYAMWKRWAVAATVLLAFGLAARMTLRPGGRSEISPTAVAQAPAVTITQMLALSTANHQPPVTRIQIGPPDEPAAQWQAELSQPRIVIAPGRRPVEDMLLAWNR